MKLKEARDLLILESAGAARDRKERQANAMAILALEYRIPKKPIKKENDPRYECPACKSTIERWSSVSFCKWCGQSIDWEDKR